MGQEETPSPEENLLEGAVVEAPGPCPAELVTHYMVTAGMAETTAAAAGAECPLHPPQPPGTSVATVQACGSSAGGASSSHLLKGLSLDQA